MPYRTIPGSTKYALIAFDADGNERTDDPDGVAGRFSTTVLDELRHGPYTDVFLFSHGWMGDIPAAIDQYDRWIGAMDTAKADRDRMARLRPGFKPLWIGIHWPSKPWGDEEFRSAAISFSPGDDPVERYVERLGDRPGLREALEILVREAAIHPDARELPPAAVKAYRDIDALMTELGESGEGAAPGNDREEFDPNACFAAAQQQPVSFGLAENLGGILAPLRQLSFWKMKQRARAVGETGLHALLGDLQQAAGGRGVRFHLMGHSFGCIVVSAMLCGPPADNRPVAPVASLALVQGALSLWSLSDSIPGAAGQPGYFRRLTALKKVAGPILTTRSAFDTANAWFYPLGAGVAGQVDFAPGSLPRYGAVGAFGAQGMASEGTDMPMRGATEDYGFAADRIYNLEASQFVRNGTGPAGAHNDIAGPEVAHAIWQAALPTGN